MFPLQREKRPENNTWPGGGCLWETKWLTTERLWHEITLVRETLAGCGRGQSVWIDNTEKKSSSTADEYILKYVSGACHVTWHCDDAFTGYGNNRSIVLTVQNIDLNTFIFWCNQRCRDISKSGSSLMSLNASSHPFHKWDIFIQKWREVLVSLCPKHRN